MSTDPLDPAAVKASIETIERELGPIDQAVLNAGSHQPVHVAELTAAAFRDLVAEALSALRAICVGAVSIKKQAEAVHPRRALAQMSGFVAVIPVPIY